MLWLLLLGIAVVDEHGARLSLPAQGRPALVLPIFTRCSRSCPLTAMALKQSRAPFRVILFSFDPSDGPDELKEFRERLELPADWTLVRSEDAAATRAFFDELGFHFMQAGGGFDHPNQAYVFSPRGRLATALAGTDLSPEALERSYRRAAAIDDHPFAEWLRLPQAWIVIACAGICASLVAIFRGSRSALFR